MKLFKKMASITLSLMTIANFMLPSVSAYAEEPTTEPVVESAHLNVNVEGEGEVKVTVNNTDYTVTKTNSLTMDTETNTSVHFKTVKEDTIVVHDFKLDDVTVSSFIGETPSFEYDYVTTSSDATFTIAFETKLKDENTSIKDSNADAKDTDVGEMEEVEEDNLSYSASNDAGGAGGQSGTGGGANTNVGDVYWEIHDNNDMGLGDAGTVSNPNTQAIINLLKQSAKNSPNL